MRFAPGQIWTFPETDELPQLLLTVGRVDAAEDLGADPGNSDVVSVSLKPAEEDWPAIDHVPFAAAALSGGELVLEGGSVPAGFDAGYTTWRAAFAAGEAGVFTLSPSQAYGGVLQAAAPES